MKSIGTASDHQRTLPVQHVQDEAEAGERRAAESTQTEALLSRLSERENLQRALKQVRQNKGAPGIDGMTVDALPDYLEHHWPELLEQLIAGAYRSQPVRRLDIPKPDGKTCPLGVPAVLDRFIQQAIAQVIRAQWEPHFHPRSYRYRPQRSVYNAVCYVQATIREGRGWLVDLDLQAFFDRGQPHERLMARLKIRCQDRDLLRLFGS